MSRRSSAHEHEHESLPSLFSSSSSSSDPSVRVSFEEPDGLETGSYAELPADAQADAAAGIEQAIAESERAIRVQRTLAKLQLVLSIAYALPVLLYAGQKTQCQCKAPLVFWLFTYQIHVVLHSATKYARAFYSPPYLQRRGFLSFWLDNGAFIWWYLGIGWVFTTECDLELQSLAQTVWSIHAIVLVSPCFFILLLLLLQSMGIRRANRLIRSIAPLVAPPAVQRGADTLLLSRLKRVTFKEHRELHGGTPVYVPPTLPPTQTATDAAPQPSAEAQPATCDTTASAEATGAQGGVAVADSQDVSPSSRSQGGEEKAARKASTKSAVEPTCPICFEDYEDAQTVLCLPCNPRKHFFHEACVEAWLRTNSSCPICRADIQETLDNQAAS